MKKALTIFLFLFPAFTGYVLLAQTPSGHGSMTFYSKNYDISGKNLISGQQKFIPDGPLCPEQCVTDSIQVTDFPSGLLIDTNTDIESICLNIEHSYAGDLGFTITCPNGQYVILDPNVHDGGAYLGVPLGGNNHSNFDGVDKCDPLDNGPGTGWTYCWSELYPTQGTLGSISYTGGTVQPTDLVNNLDYIAPENPLSGLIGCPLNGLWELRICDDFGSDNGWLFGWELTYGGSPNITGNVYYDVNENGIRDSAEFGLSGQLIRLDPGPYYKSTMGDGAYSFYRDSGNYSLSLIPCDYWRFTGDSNYFFTLNNPLAGISGLDFGIVPRHLITDVSINYTGTNSHASHFEDYYLGFNNLGTTIQHGTVHLLYDSLMTLVSSSLTPDLHTGNLMEWNYDSLIMFQSRQIILTFQMPGWSNLGNTMTSYSWIDPILGDTNTLNNFDTLTQIVIGPSDPNYKETYPAGEGIGGFIQQGQELTYTVHFQNIGTDTARSVMIIDSIDSDMNIETFILLSSSHPMVYEVYGQGVIKFLFMNIMLPDSATNEPGSQGFVKFVISPGPGLPEYTEVKNKAYIVFDYNPDIITNEVLNTYVSSTIGLIDIISTNSNFIIFPNPFSATTTLRLSDPVQNATLTIYDMMGKEVKQLENLSGKEINILRENMKRGMYFFRLYDGFKLAAKGKFVVE